jgi:Bax protein
MKQLRYFAVASLIALLYACSADPGYQAYKAYVAEHLNDLQWVDAAGTERVRPDYPVDYNALPDFAAIEDTRERKQAFFDYLRPAIAHRNAVNAERQLLLGGVALRLEKDLPLQEADRAFLDNMRRYYKVPEGLTDAEAVPVLKRRMGTIPESMVLAQAALESGWGRSRFAREANNLFGQWCYEEGCGMVPSRRNSGARHEVRAFASVDEAIDAYYRNINTHPVYKPVRDIRAQATASDQSISGLDMARGLERYSERGDAYIEEVQQVIRVNGLEKPRGRG